MKSQVLHTLLGMISAEAADKIYQYWNTTVIVIISAECQV